MFHICPTCQILTEAMADEIQENLERMFPEEDEVGLQIVAAIQAVMQLLEKHPDLAQEVQEYCQNYDITLEQVPGFHIIQLLHGFASQGIAATFSTHIT